MNLTLVLLLNNVAGEFCALRAQHHSTLKAALIAYSRANEKYGGENVRRVIANSHGIEVAAVAAVSARCPSLL
jgi:hypothetical protein